MSDADYENKTTSSETSLIHNQPVAHGTFLVAGTDEIKLLAQIGSGATSSLQCNSPVLQSVAIEDLQGVPEPVMTKEKQAEPDALVEELQKDLKDMEELCMVVKEEKKGNTTGASKIVLPEGVA